jgi:N-methylhydantoinase A/oxoprolinase/acetone carboxylase beta subunit
MTQSKGSKFAIAVDIGGTFTDVVLTNLDRGQYQLLKVPSTPEDPA